MHRAWPRAEPELPQRAPDVGTAHETDLRVELLADTEPLDLHAVPIARKVQLRTIARVLALYAFGLRTRPVRVDGEVVEEVEGAIHPVCAVGARAHESGRPAGHEATHTALAQDVAFHADDREVRGL